MSSFYVCSPARGVFHKGCVDHTLDRASLDLHALLHHLSEFESPWFRDFTLFRCSCFVVCVVLLRERERILGRILVYESQSRVVSNIYIFGVALPRVGELIYGLSFLTNQPIKLSAYYFENELIFR